jgi:hypothetical protein
MKTGPKDHPKAVFELQALTARTLSVGFAVSGDHVVVSGGDHIGVAASTDRVQQVSHGGLARASERPRSPGSSTVVACPYTPGRLGERQDLPTLRYGESCGHAFLRRVWSPAR